MSKPKTLPAAINSILDSVETLISNSATPAARAARLARAECDIAASNRDAEPERAAMRSAKLAEAERDVAQGAIWMRNVAVYQAQRARRGW
jgi:hypothetical protein